MKRNFWFIVLSLSGAGVGVTAPPRPERPIPVIERVVIISVDGLRPDLLLLADAPVMRGLIKTGAYSLWAQTTDVAVTLPSHVSMLTGMTPQKHGIEWNESLSFTAPVFPRFRTVFETAKLGGYATAMIAGKAKFSFLAKPGTIDYLFLPEKGLVEDAQIVAETRRAIREVKPDLLVVHFPNVDRAGHQIGWGSPQQLTAIKQADDGVGQVLAALAEAGMSPSTLIILTSDHGGSGKDHGPGDARSRHIPWIVHGPGVRAGWDLTREVELEIHTEDTAATAMYLLGAPLPAYLQGKPVLSAFENVPK